MKKRQINKLKKNKIYLKGIQGWLLIVLLLCILSLISVTLTFISKLILVFTSSASFGVYISAFLLLFYCIFIGSTIYFIFKKKKAAKKCYLLSAIFGAIFLIWYYIIAVLLFTQDKINLLLPNSINVLLNIILSIIITLYLYKSKRVKNTLI